MRYVRMLGLCLVAALAVAAIGASSAFAGPEWGKCVAKPGGNYKDANCTEKAKPKGSGEYEWLKASQVATKREAEGKSPGVPFTGINIGSGGVLTTHLRVCFTENALETGEYRRETRQACEAEEGFIEEGEETTATKVECESEHSVGETAGTNAVKNITVTFQGCRIFGFLPCTTSGHVEGEIQVNPLKGKLGYISKSEHKVGVLLEPVNKKTGFASFDCHFADGVVVGAGNNKEGADYVKGTNYPNGCAGAACTSATPTEEKHGGYDGIISPITPVDHMTSKYTQVYSENQATDENIPSKFEGKHIDLLEAYTYSPENPEVSFSWSAAGEEITNENTAEEAGEIKA